MKRYDSIWVPDDSPGMKETFDPVGEPIKDLSNVIVLTIEDLRTLWTAAERRFYEETRAERTGEEELILSPDFETYIKNKGINI